MINKTSLNIVFCLTAAILLHSCSRQDGAGPSNAPQAVQDASTVTEQNDPNIAEWPEAKWKYPKNEQLETRIGEILGKMTLDQKIGQMVQASIRDASPADVKKYYLGSVLNGGGMYPENKRESSPAEWLALADAYYQASMDMPEGVPAIPVIWGTDAVHGHNNVIGATYFPHNIGLGASGNIELVEQIGAATAKEVEATGIDWTFAPTLAVVRNIRWGRTYEGYSEKPEVVADFGAALIRGLQGKPGDASFLKNNKILATAKHFVADGGTIHGDDQGDSDISKKDLIEIHGYPYYEALSAGAQTVMASYSAWKGIRMHENANLLTRVLKGRMGFDGFVISDWNAIDHIAGCSRASCPQAFNAGVDMMMAPYKPDWKLLIQNTKAQVEAGEIPMTRIDDAVTRILRVKMRAGLFDSGKPSERVAFKYKELLGTKEHRALARQAVRESLVLLKNDNSILPLSQASNILVAGNAAQDLVKQTGGWTISWQGNDVKHEEHRGGQTVLAGIKEALKGSKSKIQFSEEGEYSDKPDVAIVVFGEDAYAEMHGDIQNLNTLEFEKDTKHSLAILKKLKGEGITVVSVFIAGRPLVVTPELNHSDAFVMAWLPGSEGAGIADVLFKNAKGETQYDFKGRLTFSWPKHPCHGGDKRLSDPLFDYGYGLNYQTSKTLGHLPVVEETFNTGCDIKGNVATKSTPLSGEQWNYTIANVSLESKRLRDAASFPGISATVKNNTIEAEWKASTGDSLIIRNGKSNNFVNHLAAGHALIFDLRVWEQESSSKFDLAMECSPLCAGAIKVDAKEKKLVGGKAKKVYAPLSCFDEKGTDFAKINSPLRISTGGNLKISLSQPEIGPAPEGAIALCE